MNAYIEQCFNFIIIFLIEKYATLKRSLYLHGVLCKLTENMTPLNWQIYVQDWLQYGEGIDVNKMQYDNMLGELKSIGDPILQRSKDAKIFAPAYGNFTSFLDNYDASVTKRHDRDTNAELNTVQHSWWICYSCLISQN